MPLLDLLLPALLLSMAGVLELNPVGHPAGAAPAMTLVGADETSSPDERSAYVLRSLSPRHPENVRGLRLTATGTGFFVAPGMVLTNYHVAGTCKALTVGNNSEGEEVAASFTAGNAGSDLALLSVPDAAATPAEFQTALDQEPGNGLSIVGYPEHGLPVRQAELNAVVASPDDLVADRPGFPFAGSVRRGDSGSPVLDRNGAVIGMVRAKIDTVAVYRATREMVDNIGFAIGSRSILGFLAAHQVRFVTSSQELVLSSNQVLSKAHGFVRQISCWN